MTGRGMGRPELGLAVVGAGRIGTLRARLAAKHPAVGFLAIADRDAARARALAEQTNADLYTDDNDEIIAHPRVTAVVVSTPEGRARRAGVRRAQARRLESGRRRGPPV